MESTTIDEISIEIDGNAKSAGSGLDNLKASIDKLYSSLDTTLNKLVKFNSALISLKSTLGNGIDVNIDTSKVDNLKEKLSSVAQATKNIKDSPTSITSDTFGIEKVKQNLSEVNNSAERTKGIISSLISNFFGLGNSVAKPINSIAKGINGVAKAYSKVRSILDSVKSATKKTFNGNDISSGIKKISKYAFALFSIRGTYALLNSAANRWLSSSNAAAKQLSVNIDYLKFAAGSALAPVIQYLVNLVYALLKGIQKVAYALTGVNIFANATASSMSSAAKSAKEAAKSLAPFDELNVIDFGSSSGGGSGDIAPSLDLSQMDDATNSILEAIKRGDWYAVGLEIGNKINEALDKIPWNEIQRKAEQIATNIANLINGFVDGLDWKLLGKTIGEGLNTALIFSNTFLTKTNFEKIGTSFADGLNSIINTIKWGLLGKTIGNRFNATINTLHGFLSRFNFKTLGQDLSIGLMNAIKTIEWGKIADNISLGIIGIFNTITGFIKELDWKTVVDAILEFIGNIDWSGISQAIFTALGSAAASLVNLGQVIGDYIMQGLTGLGNYFLQKTVEAGGNIVEGFRIGIIDGLKNIGQWVIDHIFQPFINGFKDAFKIHSPSIVMEELGIFIIQGLLDGINSLVGNVTTIAQNIWNGFTGTLSGIATWVNNTIIQPVKNFFNGLINVITDIGKSIYNGFTGAISSLGNFVNNKIINPVKTSFTSLWNTLSGIFNNIKNAISNTLSNINIKIKLPHFSWTTQPAPGWVSNILSALSLPTSLPKLNISWYAEGGFPDVGQLFVANEAGPELIGNIGNKTAVANNDQITTAIAKATYEAVSKALFENQENEQQIVINLGNETLYKGMTRNRNQASNQYGITV